MSATTTDQDATTMTVDVCGTRCAHHAPGPRTPTSNSADLARRLPNAQLEIYPDGHGGIFQHHAEFVPQALDFPAARDPRRGPPS